MNIEVKYYATIRQVTIVRTEAFTLPQGSTLRDLLLIIAAKHGENLYNYIFDATGKPTDYLDYLINDSNIHSLGGFDTVLTDGDMIAVVPSLGAS